MSKAPAKTWMCRQTILFLAENNLLILLVWFQEYVPLVLKTHLNNFIYIFKMNVLSKINYLYFTCVLFYKAMCCSDNMGQSYKGSTTVCHFADDVVKSNLKLELP